MTVMNSRTERTKAIAFAGEERLENIVWQHNRSDELVRDEEANARRMWRGEYLLCERGTWTLKPGSGET